jgi:hypothetical protein
MEYTQNARGRKKRKRQKVRFRRSSLGVLLLVEAGEAERGKGISAYDEWKKRKRLEVSNMQGGRTERETERNGPAM